VKPPKPAPPVVRSADALGVERSLVDQARSALARQDYASALTALEDHEKRFPRGQLAEERSALKVVALNGAGRHDDARAAAKAFKARWPDSLLMQLVDSAQ
jgi:outer membrane protein assembly factor BamD (BamD/ComL family)